ncbi:MULTISPECIES: IS66 family transposase [unclassified Sedimentibacter]|uniref:IS66 family transposase n=1 Tax=unclassified Sedimentibacter TaxID=2649220 RepID=UPI0027E101B6|nr:transposase [Sedimentibacter sp. MB35-C1]WMJ77520.1 transposase [Sedimentibacter sp. MB35-C1]
MLISQSTPYQNIDEVTNVFCWAHVRRYFLNSIPLDSKGIEVPGLKGNEGREYINKLFKIEDKISGLSLEQKFQKRQEGIYSNQFRKSPVFQLLLALFKYLYNLKPLLVNGIT